MHRVRLDWDGGLEADRAKSPEDLEQLTEKAKRLGQAHASTDSRDHQRFQAVHHADWSNTWQARFVSTCRELLALIEELETGADAFAAQGRVPYRRSSVRAVRSLATIAALVPVAAKWDLGFALGPDGRVNIDAVESARRMLGEHRTAVEQLACRYPVATIGTAPVAAWRSEWQRIHAKIWPVRTILAALFRRRLRKQLDLPAPPDPERDLPVLAELQSLQSRMDETTRTLPAGSPWSGLDTDEPAVESIVLAAKAIREATARLANNAADLPNLRVTVHQFLVGGRELVQDGMQVSEAAERLCRIAGRFETTLATYLREAGSADLGIDDLATLREQTQAILDAQPRINAWCRWQNARQEADAAGLGVLVAALESGTLEGSDAEESFRTAYCDWLATRLIDSRAPLRTFAVVEHEEKIRLFRQVDQNVADLSVEFIRARLSGDDPARDAPVDQVRERLREAGCITPNARHLSPDTQHPRPDTRASGVDPVRESG